MVNYYNSNKFMMKYQNQFKDKVKIIILSNIYNQDNHILK